MFKWVVSRVTDILIAFTLATLLLAYGAITYPEYFPQRFFRYWTLAAPGQPAPLAVATPVPQVVSDQAPVLTQVQR